MSALSHLPNATSGKRCNDASGVVLADRIGALPVFRLSLKEDAGRGRVGDFPAAGSVSRLHRHVGFDRIGVRVVDELEPRMHELWLAFRHDLPSPSNNFHKVCTLDDNPVCDIPSTSRHNNSHDFILLACEPTGRPSPVELIAGSGA